MGECSAKVCGGGPRTKNKWDMYDTITSDVHAASDHAAIYADITW